MKKAKLTALPTRRIQIIGMIDDDNTRNFFEHMNALEDANSKQNIEIELHSEGGYAYNALAIVGRMRQSPCKIIVTGYAQVASAAVVILAAGNYRRISREAFVQVHEDSGKMKGTVTELEKHVALLRHNEDLWNSVLAELTGTAFANWARLHKEDSYLTPSICVQLKLVDEII